MKYRAALQLNKQLINKTLAARKFHSQVITLDQAADKKGLFGWSLFGNKDKAAPAETKEAEAAQEVVEAEWTQVETPAKAAVTTFYQPKELTKEEKLNIVKEQIAQVLGSQTENLETVSLEDGKLKFKLLKEISKNLGQDIPNRTLNNIQNCQNIVDYLVEGKDEMTPIGSHQVDEFIKEQKDLPNNLTFI